MSDINVFFLVLVTTHV